LLIKKRVMLLLVLWSDPCIAHRGIGAGVGLAYLFYLLLVIIPIPLFAIAFVLRKKRLFSNWLMLVLVGPTFLVGVFLILLAPAALYQNDGKFALIAGIVGAAQVYVVHRLRLSCEHYHASST